MQGDEICRELKGRILLSSMSFRSLSHSLSQLVNLSISKTNYDFDKEDVATGWVHGWRDGMKGSQTCSYPSALGSEGRVGEERI